MLPKTKIIYSMEIFYSSTKCKFNKNTINKILRNKIMFKGHFSQIKILLISKICFIRLRTYVA